MVLLDYATKLSLCAKLRRLSTNKEVTRWARGGQVYLHSFCIKKNKSKRAKKFQGAINHFRPILVLRLIEQARGLEPSAMARGVLGASSRSAQQMTSRSAKDDWAQGCSSPIGKFFLNTFLTS